MWWIISVLFCDETITIIIYTGLIKEIGQIMGESSFFEERDFQIRETSKYTCVCCITLRRGCGRPGYIDIS